MKQSQTILRRVGVLVAGFLVASLCFADNKIFYYDIELALQAPEAKAALDDTVRFYFADQAHSAVLEKFGNEVANRKTNLLGKSGHEACQWVFLSALLALREQAIDEGANAVINIRSYFKKRSYVSQDKYECQVGNVVAGVALKGDLVKLEKPE